MFPNYGLISIMILVNIFQIFGEASAQEAFEEFVGKKKLLNLRIISYDMEFLINEKINSIYLLERDSAKKTHYWWLSAM